VQHRETAQKAARAPRSPPGDDDRVGGDVVPRRAIVVPGGVGVGVVPAIEVSNVPVDPSKVASPAYTAT